MFTSPNMSIQHLGSDARGTSGHERTEQDFSDMPTLPSLPTTIERERGDLDDVGVNDFILGPIIGGFVPLTSTPIANRSQTTTAGSVFVSEASPIERGIVEPHQLVLVNAPRTPRRALFQESNGEGQVRTETPTRQATLDSGQGTPTQGTPIASSSSGGSRTTPSPSVSATKTKKKGKSVNTSFSISTHSSAKKRKKSPNQVEAGKRAPGKRQKTATYRRNDSGIDGDISLNSQNSNTSVDSDYVYIHEDDDQEGVSSRSTVPYFSIHRLPVDQLHVRFKDHSLTEFKIIEKIMDEVNEDTKRRYKGRKVFERRTATIPGEKDAEDKSETSFQQTFSIVPYIQEVPHRVPILAALGIYDKGVEINLIIFYHRENDIYVITTRSTWQAIQKYSCYEFPCKISGRLTVADGNLAETAKHIAGNVRSSKTKKKNATLLDSLRNIRLNVTKEVRKNSSLYRLKEFNSSDASKRGKVTRRQVKMDIGMAFVRLLTRIDLKNFPEILDHFSKINRGEDTFTFPDNRLEKHIDETSQIRIMRGEEAQHAEESFYELIQKFMHNQHTDLIRKFDFVDKHIDDFCSAEEFKLIYNNGRGKRYDIVTFPSCPTALEVLSAIKGGCGEDLTVDKRGDKLSQSNFSRRFKNHVRVQYRVNGRKEITNKRVVNLFEGEMTIYDKDYWKIMGQWYFFRDYYYYEIYREFRDLLNKPGVYKVNEHLTQPWNRQKIKTVQDYVQLYANEAIGCNYFPPPSQEELEGIALNEQDDESTFDPRSTEGKNYFFDLMRVCKHEDGQCEFWLFYIFNGFDARIRDASTRIKKSIEMLLLGAPTTSTKSLLEKFYDHWVDKSNYFQTLFTEYEMFRQPLTSGNRVNIVVAFATERQIERPIIVPMSQYVGPTNTEENNFTATLDRERDLRLNFNLTNVEEILTVIQNSEPIILEYMCTELGIVTDSGIYNMDLLTAKVLGLLMINDYCVQNGSVNTDKPVTGKLLKMRDYKGFKLFENDKVNKKLFETLQRFYITGFPGITHKLECFQIVEDVSKEARLKLNFVEIK